MEKTYNTEEMFRESQNNVKKLNEKLKDIESLHNEIKESVSLSLKNPILFKELAGKFSDSAGLYLTTNNKIFDDKIIAISLKITTLGSEINRLVNVDFNLLFKDLETKFLENSKTELAKELKKLDEKANDFQSKFADKIKQLNTEITRLVEVDFNLLFKDLETKFLENSKVKIDEKLKQFDEKAANFQSKNDDLGIEITRLSEIDLEAHFDRHQNKLSEIFNAINSINSALSNISSNINRIIQNLGEIEQTLSKNQRENNVNFDLIKQNQANDKKELLTKIDESNVILNALIAQNELLKKDINLNKKISFGIIGLLIIAVIIIIKYL